MSRLLVLLVSSLLLSACSLFTPKNIINQSISPPAGGSALMTTSTPPITETISTTSAVIKTNLGDITVQLFPDKAPNTVANFIGLADGSKNWTDPKTGQAKKNIPLYGNTIFHRVIKGFMIQGGDPLGLGTGGPGYRFADEIDSSLTFSQPYLLAMANAGPNTNGSQFFITLAPTPWLNGKHTIFGKVTVGQNVVDKISTVPTGPNDKPLTDIVIQEIQVK